MDQTCNLWFYSKILLIITIIRYFQHLLANSIAKAMCDTIRIFIWLVSIGSAVSSASVNFTTHKDHYEIETNDYEIFRGTTTATLMDDQRDNLKPLECEFAPGLVVGSRARELECCNETSRYYYRNWGQRSFPLTTFLQTLRQWNCPQYEEQCSSRVFAFTDFSKLVYDYFCNYTLLVEKCLPQVTATSAVQKHFNVSNNDTSLESFSFIPSASKFLLKRKNSVSSNFQTQTDWKNAISRINVSEMTFDELLEPCIQIAQYDQTKTLDGSYKEVISVLNPTCELTWCGFSAEAFRSHKISFWSCLSSR